MIWLYTVCKGRVYLDSAGQRLTDWANEHYIVSLQLLYVCLTFVWKGVSIMSGEGPPGEGSRSSGSTPVTPALFDSKCADIFDRWMFSLWHNVNTSPTAPNHPPTHPTGKGGGLGGLDVYIVSMRKHANNVQGRIQDGFGGGSI